MDYKKMYLHLFNEVTKAIEILKAAQCDCEEIFLDFDGDTNSTDET